MPTDISASTTAGAATPCTVSVSAEAPPWGEYLAARPEATVFHDPRWGQVMAAAYGSRPRYLTAVRDGKTVGVLPLVGQRSLLFGSHLSSLPYFDAAGMLADDAAAAEAILAQAALERTALGARWVELRQETPIAGSLPVRTDKVTLRLALPPDPQVLWKKLNAKVRNQVRKAQGEGQTVTLGGAELLDEFHGLYVRTMRDLGSPPHSRRFFALIAERFAAVVRIHVVRAGARPMAASLTLADAHAVRVPWAASDWRFRQSCANMLLYWSMLEEACRRAAPVFDFGRSTRDSGTYRFKTQWGAAEVPLFWHYLLPDGSEVPELRPDSPKFRLATAVWRRLPLGVARVLGPRLIAGLS
jgi:FemAB-related protein (PEP-CTERM system-associated)